MEQLPLLPDAELGCESTRSSRRAARTEASASATARQLSNESNRIKAATTLER